MIEGGATDDGGAAMDQHDGHVMPGGADAPRTGDPPGPDARLTRAAVTATAHCLTGCAIGEILGLALGTWWGWGDGPTIVLAIALAFVFGYAMTVGPLLRSGLGLRGAVRIALVADTVSIVTMELVDNAILLLIPGAMAAGLGDLRFWTSLAFALGVAFVVTVPVNRWLIARGRGHAVAAPHHHG